MTTLVTGSRASSRGARSGFSLLEIVLAIALIAIASGVIIGNFTTFLSFDDQLDPEETLHQAIRSARFQAANDRDIAALRFDKEAGALVIEGGETFPLNSGFAADGPGEIRFFVVPPAEGMEPFSEAADSKIETLEVRFAPDRSSTPFVAEIDNGQGTPTRLVFDPFSSLVRSSE